MGPTHVGIFTMTYICILHAASPVSSVPRERASIDSHLGQGVRAPIRRVRHTVPRVTCCATTRDSEDRGPRKGYSAGHLARSRCTHFSQFCFSIPARMSISRDARMVGPLQVAGVIGEGGSRVLE